MISIREKAGNQSLVRNINQRALLGIIREYGSISRADLARKSGLSAPSVSANVKVMIEKELIRETDTGKSRGGRKPLMLEFNPEFKLLLSVVLTHDLIKIALGNLTLKIIFNETYARNRYIDEKDPCRSIIDLVNRFLEENRIDIKSILCLCVVTPGIVNTVTGAMIRIHAKYINWFDIPFKTLLEEEFKIKAYIHNDVDASATAELHFLRRGNLKNMIYMCFDPGVGAGIIVDGRILKGSSNCAGEIGYLKGFCSGKYLEDEAAIPVLMKRIRLSLSDETISLADIEDLYTHNTTSVKDIVDEFIEVICNVVNNVNCVIDAEQIILGGGITKLGHFFIEQLNKRLNSFPKKTPVIRYSDFGEEISVYGGFAVCSEYLYQYI